MGGWLVQVPVKRFGTEALVHLYAVWMPDHTQRAGRDAQRVRRAAGSRHMATVSLLTDLKPGLFSWN